MENTIGLQKWGVQRGVEDDRLSPSIYKQLPSSSAHPLPVPSWFQLFLPGRRLENSSMKNLKQEIQAREFLAEDGDTENKGIKWTARHFTWTVRPPDPFSLLGSRILAARWISLRKEAAPRSWDSASCWGGEGPGCGRNSHTGTPTQQDPLLGVSCNCRREILQF